MYLKKNNLYKYIILVVFVLLITAALVFILFTQNSAYDPDSEKIIRQAAAKRLNKDPNELTDKDFAKIKVLHFAEIKPGLPTIIAYRSQELTEISLLEKFKNLQKLNLANIRYKIPTWMKFMAEHGIIDLEDRFEIDLSPIANLSNLEALDLQHFPINSLEPLSKLTNLKMLDISNTPVSDIEPLKNLTNLQHVVMLGCKNITDKQVEDLKRAIPKLKIEYIQIMPKNVPYIRKSPIPNMLEFKDFQPESENINPEEGIIEIHNKLLQDII